MRHNWPVYGHDWAVDYLEKSIRNQRVRHAYLVVGPPSIGKNTLAHAFAQHLNCLHDDELKRPCNQCRACRLIKKGGYIDVLYSANDPTTKLLKIDAVRDITRQLAIKPYEARYKVAIFRDFDKAQPRAQDALLKTLEEPPSYAVLILLATSVESILSTITSRSQIISLRPAKVKDIYDLLMLQHEMLPEKATLLARLSGGRIGWAIQTTQQPEILQIRDKALDLLEALLNMNRTERFDIAQDLGRDKPSLHTLLELWLSYWRDVLLQVLNSPVNICNIDRQTKIEQLAYDIPPEQALNALQATRNLLDQMRFNINLRIALEVMFLDYPGLSWR